MSLTGLCCSSELIPYAESYERIFDRIYAIRGCSDTSHASTVCDLVLLTRDPAVAVKANKSLEDIQSSLTLLMHEVLQFGYSELWQDMEMTMGLLRRIIGMVSEVEWYSEMGVDQLREAVEQTELMFQQ